MWCTDRRTTHKPITWYEPILTDGCHTPTAHIMLQHFYCCGAGLQKEEETGLVKLDCSWAENISDERSSESWKTFRAMKATDQATFSKAWLSEQGLQALCSEPRAGQR